VNHGKVVRAVLAGTVLVISVVFALTESPRLGLDLRGGTQITLETRNSLAVKADRESTERTLEVLRLRVDALGVAEPAIAQSGERRIIVELPGVNDAGQAAALLGRTAQLTFHPVLGTSVTPPPIPAPAQGAQQNSLVLADEGGQPLRLGPAGLTGEGVRGAAAQLDPQSAARWFVTMDFHGSGERAWAQLTGKAACAPAADPARRVAIVLDNEIISSPQVDPQVACNVGIAGGSTEITGRFTAAEARDLALLIRGGALPVPVDIIEQRTVGPTLGQAAIEASATAAMIGVGLTGLFVLLVYRLLGGIAAVALAGYGLISYASLLALGATLTLPGLAGFVLAIGMAVDANVLVFERAREEYAARGGRSLRAALSAGFRNALSAIADSNVTTLLAAGLLFFLASVARQPVGARAPPGSPLLRCPTSPDAMKPADTSTPLPPSGLHGQHTPDPLLPGTQNPEPDQQAESSTVSLAGRFKGCRSSALLRSRDPGGETSAETRMSPKLARKSRSRLIRSQGGFPSHTNHAAARHRRPAQSHDSGGPASVRDRPS